MVILLFSTAVVLRLWRYASAVMDRDAATCGLLGLDVLKGNFPLFFYGQKFMGTLDAYLAAPIYAWTGASSLAVNFLPFLLSLGTMLVLYWILKKQLQSWGLMIGIACLAFPPAFALYWVGEARTHYPLALFLSALILLLTVTVLERNKPDSKVFFIWGLLSGCAFWTNFLTAIVIGTCGFFLLLMLRFYFWRPSFPWLILGLLVGASPLIYFCLYYGWPWWNIETAQEVLFIGKRLNNFFFIALPGLFGIHSLAGIDGLSINSLKFLTSLGWLSLFLVSLVRLTLSGLRSPIRTNLLPPVLVLVNCSALLIGGNWQSIGSFDQRYLLPLILILPWCWGFWGTVRWKAPWPTLLLALLVVGTAIHGYSTFRINWGVGGSLLDVRQGFYLQREGKMKEQLETIRKEGFEYLYGDDLQMAFLAAGKPIISHPWAEEQVSSSVLVDAAINPGFMEEIGKSAHLLGLSYRLWQNRIFHSFAEPQGAERLLERDQWKFYSLQGEDLGRSLHDGDFTTGFTVGEKEAEGNGFLLDFGREEAVSGLALIVEDFRKMPAGLRLEGAGSDLNFKIIRETNGYWGPFYFSGPHPFLKIRYPRVECYFKPQTLRYLRLTNLGQDHLDLSTRECLVFGPGQRMRLPTWSQTADQLVRVFSTLPLRRVYADAWPSAVIRSRVGLQPAVLLANEYNDEVGLVLPHTLPLLDPGVGNGLLIAKRETSEVALRLGRSGIRSRSMDLGRYTLFILQGRQMKGSLPLAASYSESNPKEAAGLVHGYIKGKRWSTGTPQRPGLSLILDGGRSQPVEWITLHNPYYADDYPRGLRAEFSQDGRNWDPVSLDQTEPLVFSGQLLLSSRGSWMRYRCQPAIKTRFLRLTLTQSDPVYWWSVEKVEIHAPQVSPGN